MHTDFQIVTAGIPATADEWLRAQELPESQLPQLTEADRPRVRRRWMSDLQYRRHLALRQFATEREKADAEALGRRIQRLLAGYSEGVLEALVRRGQAYEWEARVRLSQNGQTVLRTFIVTKDGLAMDEATFADALQHILQTDAAMREAV